MFIYRIYVKRKGARKYRPYNPNVDRCFTHGYAAPFWLERNDALLKGDQAMSSTRLSITDWKIVKQNM